MLVTCSWYWLEMYRQTRATAFIWPLSNLEAISCSYLMRKFRVTCRWVACYGLLVSYSFNSLGIRVEFVLLIIFCFTVLLFCFGLIDKLQEEQKFYSPLNFDLCGKKLHKIAYNWSGNLCSLQSYLQKYCIAQYYFIISTHHYNAKICSVVN